MNHTTTLIVVANTITLVAGALVTGIAWRAASRTGSTALRALAGGLGLVTIGALLGGTIHQIAGLDVQAAIAVHSVFTAVGFAALAGSLYLGRSGSRSVTLTRSGKQP